MKTVKRNVRSRKTLKRKYKGGSRQNGAAPRKRSMGRPSTSQLSAAQKSMSGQKNLTNEVYSLLTSVIDRTHPDIGDKERTALIKKISGRITQDVLNDFRSILERIRLQTNPNATVNGAGIVGDSIIDLRRIITDLKR
jgi:hypothetical protein